MGKLLKGLLPVLLLCAMAGVVLYSLKDRNSGSRLAKNSQDRPSKTDKPLFCQDPNVDFGYIYRPVTKLIEHSYSIENTSSKPVEIRLAGTSCACAKAELTRTLIPPGEDTRFDIAWKAPSQPGRQYVRAFVETLPSGSGGIELSGAVFVREYYVVEPQEMSFGSIKPSQVRTQQLLVQAPSGQNFPAELSWSLENNDGNDVQVVRTQASDYKVTFDVSISGQAGQGQKHYAVIIATGDPVQPEIQIPVSVNHLALCQAQPSVVMFKKAQNDKETKWVTIVSNTESLVRIQNVVVDNPSMVDVQIKKGNGNSSSIGLGLSLKGSLRQKEPCTGAVKVFIAGATQPVIVRYLCLGG